MVSEMVVDHWRTGGGGCGDYKHDWYHEDEDFGIDVDDNGDENDNDDEER